MAEITQLYIYPVKGLAGISLQEARLASRGLAFDREFMLTDASGTFISQRTRTSLALFKTELTESTLTITYKTESFHVPLAAHADSSMDVTVWSDTLPAEEFRAASAWFSERLGEELHFIRFAKNERRRVEPERVSDPNAIVAFADAYPILLVAEASLDFLNAELTRRGEAAVPMNRFRPNIVVKDMAAFDEFRDQLLSSERSELALRLVKPCRRCPVTTVNQETAIVANPKEPLASLAAINPTKTVGAFFGGNATIERGIGGTLRVGERLISS